MHVFVSDVHLNEPQSKRYGAFLRLLDKVCDDSRITDLYLVGDIFDIWVGDRKLFQDMHSEALLKIRKAAVDKNIHYFEGNHDFQLGELWKRMNVKTYSGDATFEIDGERVLIGHGDQLDQEDTGYLRLRCFFRTPLMRFLIKVMPQWIVLWIGSSMSTTEQKGKPTPEQEKAFQMKWKKWTAALRSKKDYDVFICGHHHFRADYKFEYSGKPNRALNLGTWLDGEFKVLVYTDGDFVFKTVDQI